MCLFISFFRETTVSRLCVSMLSYRNVRQQVTPKLQVQFQGNLKTKRSWSRVLRLLCRFSLSLSEIFSILQCFGCIWVWGVLTVLQLPNKNKKYFLLSRPLLTGFLSFLPCRLASLLPSWQDPPPGLCTPSWRSCPATAAFCPVAAGKVADQPESQQEGW